MAITPKKVSVTGTNTTLDSTGTPSIAWTESSKAGSNAFNVDKGTTTATLALTGTSGDVLKINGYSGDYSATLSGTKLTLQSNTQTVTVTLAKASTVKLTFADGDKIVDTAAAKLGAQVLTKVSAHLDGVTAHEAKAIADAKTASDAALAKAAADAKTALDKATADAKTALDAAVKKALTDTSGKLYTTVDAAITSNDDAAISAAVSTATGSKFTKVTDLFNAYNAYATPSFSVIAGADAKEGTNASFTFNLSAAQATTTAVNLALTYAGGASAADIDLAHATLPTGFTLVNNVLTFPAGVTTGTLAIPVVTDTTSPENGEGITITLTQATGSAAKVSTTSASGTVNFIDVPAPVAPAPVAINATSNSATATAGADTYNIAAGNYAATIAGFGTGDTLVFDPNSAQAVTNDSGSDGIIKIAGSLNNQQVVVTLTGVSAALDNQVFNLASFAKAFAPAPVVGPSTTTNISASATTGTGTSGVDTFNIASGNYNASIAGFAANDKLVFAAGSVETITNSSATDGNITVAGVLNNQLVTIQLTGVSTALDAQVFSVASFNTAFGTGSLV
jgi:hypothetical protein